MEYTVKIDSNDEEFSFATFDLALTFVDEEFQTGAEQAVVFDYTGVPQYFYVEDGI